MSSPYKVMKDVTLTAEWDYNGSSSSSGSTRYTVSVEDTDNGSVEVSPTRASKAVSYTHLAACPRAPPQKRSSLSTALWMEL